MVAMHLICHEYHGHINLIRCPPQKHVQYLHLFHRINLTLI